MFPRCVIIMNFVVVSSVVMKRVVCIFLGSPWKHVSGSVPVSIPTTCKSQSVCKGKINGSLFAGYHIYPKYLDRQHSYR